MKQKHLALPLAFIFGLALACNFSLNAEPTLDGVAALQTENARPSQSPGVKIKMTVTPIIFSPLITLTNTTQPSETASPTMRIIPTLRPSATSTTLPCDLVSFLGDVNIPDGTEIQANTTFTKTWKLQNVGSCTWTTDYSLIFYQGDSMGAVTEVYLDENIAPGQEVDISVEMVAPAVPGDYTGYWILRDPDGSLINLVEGGPFFVKIKVIPSVNTVLVYDFVANYCSATWISNANTSYPLNCPGETDDDNGFVVELDNPRLETGSQTYVDGLETHPVWYGNAAWSSAQNGGWIQGIFPVFSIEEGYRFRAQVGCLFKEGGTNCNVNFILKYSLDGATWRTMGTWHESYDARVQTLDIDLSFLNDRSVEIMLMVDANNNAGADEAVWVYPRIEK